uniref:Uncharacterized protein n=1 Tax=Cryptomonas curvata TaxID=233186 RepID=A0A7S0M672_9CRYP
MSLIAAYFWVFGSAVQPPLDEDNAVNMHRGEFEKLAQFDVPVSVSDTPTKYKAILKIMMNQTLDATLHSCSRCGSEWVLEGQDLGLLQHDTQDFILSDSGESDEGAAAAIQRFAFTPTRVGREALTFKYYQGLEDRAVTSTAALSVIIEPAA